MMVTPPTLTIASGTEPSTLPPVSAAISTITEPGALKAELDPSRYTGRAREQVAEFLAEYAKPLAARARPLAVTPDAAEVRV